MGIVSLSLLSCSGGQSDDEAVFSSDTILILDTYPKLEAECIPIMEQLQMCTTSDTVKTLPPCSNEFFQVLDLPFIKLLL